MSDVLSYIAGVLIVAGAAFGFLAALGVVRLPDLYTRLHAASKAGVVGAGLIFAAIGFASGDPAVTLRAVFGVSFLLLTTPVSAHLLARAAYLSGLKPSPLTRINEIEKARNNSP
jgi:multicomponent Na+:H+ antiporter subunit G